MFRADDLLQILNELSPSDRKEAIALASAVTEHLPWVPNPGPQTEAFFSQADEVFYGGAAGGGKLQSIQSLTLTPTGWRKIGDLKVGDKLCATDGTVQEVIGVFPQGTVSIYRVTMRDGGATEAGLDHNWLAWRTHANTKKGNRVTCGAESARKWTTRQMIAEMEKGTRDDGRRRGFAIPVTEPVNFTVAGQLKGRGVFVGREIDPYILGLLLGDGHITEKGIGLTSMDAEIASAFMAWAGEDCRVKVEQNKRSDTYALRGPMLKKLKDQLSDLDLLGCKSHDKFIPRQYLFAPIEERWALLQGLMDTDGWVEPRRACYYTTVSEVLASDVEHLARSLGAVTTRTEKNPNYTYKGEKLTGQKAYCIRIKLPNPECAFRLPRKIAVAASIEHQSEGRVIESITYVREDEAVCIAVSNANSLYITDDFIVTHNTDLLLGLALTGHTKSLVLRRTNREVNGLVERMTEILGAREGYNSQSGIWRYSDKLIELGGCQLEEDKQKYKGNAKDLYCVGPDTEVLMADGCYRRMVEIVPGDLVATLEGPKRVNRVYTIPNKDTVELSVQHPDGRNIRQLQSSAHYLFTGSGWEVPTNTTERLALLSAGTRTGTEYPHPYTGGLRKVQTGLIYTTAPTVTPIGVRTLYDMEVEEVNHFITKGGIVNKNCFDELSDFTESQYVFITGWNRSTKPGQRCRIIGAGNPPTRPEGQWVVRRWAAWLDPRHPRPAKPGELRWYTTNNKGEEEEVDGPGPHYLDGDRPLYARSRTFIPAALADNPDLVGTGYQASLDSLPAELRAAYRDGNFHTGIQDDPYQLIPSAWVIAAQERWRPNPPVGIPMCAIGCDVAVAKDKFVIAQRHDSWFAPLIVIPGKEVADPKQAAGRVLALRRDNAKVIVDVGGGWGADCYGQLTSNQIDALAYMGVKASKRKTLDGKFGFSNVRTEALWKLREALDPSQPGGSTMQLPQSVTLRADLCAPYYAVKKQGDTIMLVAESKEDVRDKLGRSPDEGDAVVMAWYDGFRLANVQGGWEDNVYNKTRTISVNRGRRYN